MIDAIPDRARIRNCGSIQAKAEVEVEAVEAKVKVELQLGEIKLASEIKLAAAANCFHLIIWPCLPEVERRSLLAKLEHTKATQFGRTSAGKSDRVILVSLGFRPSGSRF